MRKLVITRGHQGAGKTTLLRNLGIDGHLLSLDQIRQVLAGPVMTPFGSITSSQEHDTRVYAMFRDLLDERMARGELVAADATHRAASDFQIYKDLARKHRYEMVCVDFGSQPIEIALKQNLERPDYAVVPEQHLRRTHEAVRNNIFPQDIPRIMWREDGSHEARLRDWLSVPRLDLSSYRKIHHIGDLQGCLTPLTGPGGYLQDGFRDDEFYLFVGDLVDRGIENDRVIRWAMDEAMTRANVRFHWGNHEDHLHRWATGQEPVSREFRDHTLPQLKKAGIRAEDVDELCRRLVDATFYEWRGRTVMVTHAGLSTVPEHPERISTSQYARGTGAFSDPVDRRFTEAAPAGWYQVHGHRNNDGLAIDAYARSFNLEDKIEFGGTLRALTLDDGGFRGIEVPSTVFLPFRERVSRGMTRSDRDIYPDWVRTMGDRAVMDQGDLEVLRSHELIYTKASRSRPDISSINFTRDAFFEAAWDSVVVRARGLFYNNKSLEYVARSYDKFFNVGERPETTIEGLEQGLAFPVVGYVKENGFLGILGYDRERDDLFYASKSTPDSDSARWFSEIFESIVPTEKREQLKRYLRDVQATATFEVNDPVNDPHIIEYERRHIVLLDVIRNARDFEKLSYDKLTRVGQRFGLEVKERAMEFRNWQELSGFMRASEKPGWMYKGRHVEGFVFEDAKGFQVKDKLDYYRHWKYMRSLKDRIAAVRGTNKPLGRDISSPRVRQFHDWCMQQPVDLLREKGIIELRNAFVEGRQFEASRREPIELAERRKIDPAVRGFELALASLAGKPNGDAIKAQTADKMITAALEDERKMEVLARSEIRQRLVLAATPGHGRAAVAERLVIDLDDTDMQAKRSNRRLCRVMNM